MEVITSRKNPQVQHLKKLGADRAYRDACGEFLCDGVKLYEEALRSGVEITLVATSARGLAVSGATRVILVPEDVLRSISPQVSPQPIVFSCRRPEQTPHPGPKRVLILDGIQDPGNVGGLIRTAHAFAADQVILTGATADLYHPRTVRAAMGALFRQAVCVMTVDGIINYVNQNGLTLLGAALSDGGRAAGDDMPERVAFAIGNEGRGLSLELLACCHDTVRIPMEDTESLNAGVAGAILLWEVYKRSL